MSSNDIIFWTPYCGDESERWAFWDYQLTVNTTKPEFTECFENTVLVWVPCFFLWLACPFYIKHLSRKFSVHKCGNAGKLNLLKVILGILQCFLTLVEFFRTVGEESGGLSRPPVFYVTPCIWFISFLLATILCHYEYRKALHTSGVLFIFWLLVLVCEIPTYISRINDYLKFGYIDDIYRFTIFYCNFTLSLIQFGLCCIPDYSAIEDSEWQPLSDTDDEIVPLLGGPKKIQKRKQCPELRAGFFSKATFWWITPLIIQGYKKSLDFSDLWELRPADRCRTIYDVFAKEWRKEKVKQVSSKSSSTRSYQQHNGKYQKLQPEQETGIHKGKPSLLKAYARALGPRFAMAGLFKLGFDSLTLIQPQILSLLIDFVSSGSPLDWQGYALAITLFVTSSLKTIFSHHYWDGCYQVGLKIRSAMIAAIYRKALVLSSSAKKTSTQGEIVNLMSVDAQKLQDVPPQIHFVWSGPFTIIIAVIFLWQELGPSVLAGVAVLVFMVPINAWIATQIRKLQMGQMRHKDKRIKVMNEVLNGMKILKLFAWEPSFEERLVGIRDKEIKMLRSSALLQAFSSITWFIAPFLVALASFTVYVLVDERNILDAQKAFVSLALFQIMNFPLSMLPMVLASMVQANVSNNRIHKYLLLDEIDETTVDHNPMADDPIIIKDASFSWDKDENNSLKDINLTVKDGSLVAVVGAVGTGKSSLMSAILGEMYKTKGRVNVKGSVAFVPQLPWLVNASLKENILFGKEEKKAKYDRIIDACALKTDLQILPGGDQTEIGDKGINLSGGQKQRVSLARAVYQNNEIYLLDDPLSAVDSHVGKHIFDKVISNTGLLGKKTRVFVTHGVTYLPKVDYIVVFKEGQISELGTYDELISHNGAFAEFIKTYLQEADDEDDPEAEEFKATLRRQISVISGDDMSDWDSEADGLSRRRSRRGRKKSTTTKKDVSDLDEVKKSIAKKKLTTEEVAETGSVRLEVYRTYVRANGYMYCLGVLLAYVCFIACSVGTNFWLSIWSNDQPINGTQDIPLRDMRLGVYGALGFGQGLFVFLQNVCIALGSIGASRTLHNVLLARMLRSPMSFFDTTPLGRIVNRLAKDIDTVDINIPMVLRIWLMTLSSVIATVLIISITLPPFIIALLPLGILYYFAQRMYISTSRQLKRIDSVARSPIYSHFGTSLSGASSIRAYKEQDRFITMSDDLVDKNQMAWFPNIISYRWLGITLESIGNLIILITGILAVLLKDTLSPGLVGLAVSYALQVTGSLMFMVRMHCDLETYVVAVERIDEYSTVPTEAPWEKPYRKPPPAWPDNGAVEFRDFCVRYRPGLDLVLHGINAQVQPGEKVGIVGRTGAGKSSLTLALFRLIEAAGGSIVIDGQDISRLGLHDLRGRLTIIPQDPVLFSGTLRSNVDPFDKHSDPEIWKAMELAHLREFVDSNPEKLEYECTEGGENLSVGQRQLLCLARALLRKSKILLLDEATAAVDLETDDLIQNTIRKEFKNCSVLTIAHRLNTIMDYDRVMVLDKGLIKEFDTPSNLLKDSKSVFHGMARDAGLI